MLKEFKLIRGIGEEGIEGYVQKTEEMVKKLCELDEEDDKKVKWIKYICTFVRVRHEKLNYSPKNAAAGVLYIVEWMNLIY